MEKRNQVIGFFILIAFFGVLMLLVWWPFLELVALAGILAVLFMPLHQKILFELKRENLAAFFSVILILLIIVLPLWVVGQLVFNELVEVYTQFRLGNLSFNSKIAFENLPEAVKSLLLNVTNDTQVIFSKLTSNAFTLVQQLLSNLAQFFLSLFLLVFMVFFFLRDKEKIKKVFVDLSPLPATFDNSLVTKLEQAVSGIVKGSFLVALIQGLVALIGFVIFSVPQPFLWASVTVVAALVPTVGTALVIIPVVTFLFFVDRSGAAFGMLLWGVFAVGIIDNIVSPKIIGSKLQLHPLLVLLSILGGVNFFGFLGVLFGPILMSCFVALLEIYRKDLKTYLTK